MSRYDYKNEYNQPTVNQYGSHMVMTGVARPFVQKYVSLNTKFGEISGNKATFNIPERTTNVASMSVTNVEIPYTFFNISDTLENNTMTFTDNTGKITIYTVPNNNYTPASLQTYLLANNPTSTVTFTVSNTYYVKINFVPTVSVTSMNVAFSVDKSGNISKYDANSRLGWILGFRDISYTFNSSILGATATALTNTVTNKCMYLVVDEYAKNVSVNTIISPLTESMINKRIIARISLNYTEKVFNGDTFCVTTKNGLLMTDTRMYQGGFDLQKITTELIDEKGCPVNLNGQDYSFCLVLEHTP